MSRDHKSRIMRCMGLRYDDQSSFAAFIRQRLQEFKMGPDTELKMEPMTKDQRKLTRSIALLMDLKTHSSGQEGNRRITVTRRPSYRPTNHATVMAALESQPVELTDEQKSGLTDFLLKYPILQEHIDNSLSLGLKSNKGRYHEPFHGRAGDPMVIPPASGEDSRMKRIRRQLPAYELKNEILHAINTHKVTLITGGTGCGKTTQVPQFLLEDACEKQCPIRIICTQPRRLPALAVADRVAKERNEKLGTTVGYHIRLEQKTSPQTALTYCTSGVLLRMLTVDDVARSVSHILLDEIHEREQNTDYLLIALKQALKDRDDLKVILMSATMEGNLDTFLRYFGDTDVKHINIPSKLYRVIKFPLDEVLALTGYRRTSLFGGTFSSDCFKEKMAFSSFPQVDEFRCETIKETLNSKRRSYSRQDKSRTHNSAGSSEMIHVRASHDDVELITR
ncbi:hypothetical protein AB6A40_002814 [Gnathostoma spinigerum]|uniref:Helicase ATP-binding domain-containing protein n=1 Tax=Gnathostoma spinigerum TaxID=75299 RepID=A0ABD6E8V5_9BILA